VGPVDGVMGKRKSVAISLSKPFRLGLGSREGKEGGGCLAYTRRKTINFSLRGRKRGKGGGGGQEWPATTGGRLARHRVIVSLRGKKKEAPIIL